jgi:hypothetical protein
MSIRTRVLSVTLGLAIAGYVVTLRAASDDKIIIVRDGSVEVFVNNSHFREKEENKHKWSKGADSVQVFEDTTLAPCTTPVASPQSNQVPFNQVVLRIAERDNNNQTVQTLEITATNEGFFKKLNFVMPSEWQFVFKKYGHRLVFGNQERNVKLQQVVITDQANNQTTYPASPSTGVLCVVFRN